jgi:transglutaminase-like putative cysteine protease
VADTGADGGRVYLVGNNDWTETGITWSNAPVLGAAGASIGLTGGVGTWIEINVPVTGNGTWTLAVSGGGTDPVWYDSRESANAPQLLIDS